MNTRWTALQSPPAIGALLTVALLAEMARGLGMPVPELLGGLCYWLAALLCWPALLQRNRRQSLLLMLVGGGCALWGVVVQGRSLNWEAMLTANIGLISMLVAVSFLGLVSQPALDDSRRLPTGRRAVSNTLIGVHLFGAVINLSSVFILGDRMTHRRALQPAQAIALTRGFSAAAFWSPFFAAMGVALTFAPGADLSVMMSAGLPLAFVALLLTYLELGRNRQAEDFVGYPMHYTSLWLPLLLAVAVFSLRYWQPDFAVLTLITLLAPTISLALLLASRRRPAARISEHISQRLPRMGNELALFLAAGVLSAGLQLLMDDAAGWLPFERFGGTQAAICLALILVMAVLGFHPVISIALIGPLLAPLQPDANLLAVTFLSSWALGSAVGPLSGMNLAVQGRYGVEVSALMRWNLPYAAVMFVVVAVVLQCLD